MENRIKVFLNSGVHSAGRGVGFYAKFLEEALKELPGVDLTSENPDIIHYPFFDLFYPTLPVVKGKPTIVTIHDLTPLVMSDRYPRGVKGSINLWRQILSLKTVVAIITDSNNSKEDIKKFFHISDKNIFVTPLAVDPEYAKDVSAKRLEEVRKKYSLPKKFILTVAAGPNPNKNLPALAKAADELEIPLMIVGKGLLQEVTEPVHPELKDLVELKKYNDLLLPGFVSTEDLSAIYRLATVYCQPSLYEGFGLPLLEAMTAGCLVVSSNASSLPEIYHKGALSFDPKSPQAIKNAIKKAVDLSTAEKRKQIRLGLDRAKDFAWDKTVRATLEVYKLALCL